MLSTSPLSLRVYFASQLAATVGAEATFHWAGQEHIFYYLSYYVATALVFCADGFLIWTTLRLARATTLLAALVFALALTCLAYGGMTRPLRSEDWFALVTAGVEVTAGVSLALSAPFSGRRMTLGTVVVLWLALAAYDYTWALDPQGLQRLNLYWLPTTLTILAFLWIWAWKFFVEEKKKELVY